MKKAWLKLTGLVLVMVMLLGFAVAGNNTGSGEHKNQSYGVKVNATTGYLSAIGTVSTPKAKTGITTNGTTFWGAVTVKEYSQYSATPLQAASYAATITSSSRHTDPDNCKIDRAPSNVNYRYEHTGSLSIPGTGVTPDTFKYTAYQH